MDPSVPLGGPALGICPVDRGVLHENSHERVDEGVHGPEHLLDILLEQRRVLGLLQEVQQGGVAVVNMARLVGLHRVHDSRQRKVVVAHSDVGERHQDGVSERGLNNDLKRHRRLERVTGHEPAGQVRARDKNGVGTDSLMAEVPPDRLRHVLHVPPVQVHLHRGVPLLVQLLDIVGILQLRICHSVDQHTHTTGGSSFRADNGQQVGLEQLQPAQWSLPRDLGPDGGVEAAVHTIVFLVLHVQVVAHDLLHGVTARLCRHLVATRILTPIVWVVGPVPTKLADLCVASCNAPSCPLRRCSHRVRASPRSKGRFRFPGGRHRSWRPTPILLNMVSDWLK